METTNFNVVPLNHCMGNEYPLSYIQHNSDNGDDPNIDPYTLISACRYQKHNIVKMLLKAGADPNKGSEDTDSPLIAAIDSLSMLVNKDTSIDDILTTIKLLLEAGADINKKHINGWTAVSVLLKTHHKPKQDILNDWIQKILALFIEAGVNLQDAMISAVQYSPELGITPIKMILEKGLDINFAYNSDNLPLINFALNSFCISRHPFPSCEAIKLLLGSDVDINVPNKYGHKLASQLSRCFIDNTEAIAIIIPLLLEKNMEISEKEYTLLMEHKYYNPETKEQIKKYYESTQHKI